MENVFIGSPQFFERKLIEWIAHQFNLDPTAVSADSAFVDYGIDSIRSVQMLAVIEKYMNIPLEPHMVIDYPVISELAAYLYQNKDKAPIASKQRNGEVGADESESAIVIPKNIYA